MVKFTILDRISFGNKKLLIYSIVDCAAAGSTLTVGAMNKVEAVKATNNSDSSDTFMETIQSHGAASTKNQVLFDPVTDLDDGQAWIWGR